MKHFVAVEEDSIERVGFAIACVADDRDCFDAEVFVAFRPANEFSFVVHLETARMCFASQ